jgi:lysophospholipase L1-like esterase
MPHRLRISVLAFLFALVPAVDAGPLPGLPSQVLQDAVESATGTLELISPNGYQQWYTGTVRKILFAANGPQHVTIEYSPNNGIVFVPVADSVPAASGSYDWTVPPGGSPNFLVRISDTDEPSLSAVSAHVFEVVSGTAPGTDDIVFFADSPTSLSYEASQASSSGSSSLETLGGKVPVTATYAMGGNYALLLQWRSESGGDWSALIAGQGSLGKDLTAKDDLVIHVFSQDTSKAEAMPEVYLEDANGHTTERFALSAFAGTLLPWNWNTIPIPVSEFTSHSGAADLTNVTSVCFGQHGADGASHTWYLDNIRATIRPDTSRGPVVVVLGSSTAAGTGANPIDSAWVWRFTAYGLSRNPNATVVNLAIGGYTTYDIMPTGFTPPAGRPTPKTGHNITQALAYNPDVLIINLPSNDAANGYAVSEQLANYDVITSQVTDPKTTLFVSTTQPRNIADASRRALLLEMRDSTYARFGTNTMDFWTTLANPDGTIVPAYNSGDGIHLNNAGHKILFERAVAAGAWPSTSAVEPGGSTEPEGASLLQNHPNPFNPTTTILFTIHARRSTTLKVYDLLGREVSTLVSEVKEPGTYTVTWDARSVASGVYVYRLSAGAYVASRKMIFLR